MTKNEREVFRLLVKSRSEHIVPGAVDARLVLGMIEDYVKLEAALEAIARSEDTIAAVRLVALRSLEEVEGT